MRLRAMVNYNSFVLVEKTPSFVVCVTPLIGKWCDDYADIR